MKQLDAAFFALADPTRRAILARLSSGEATVQELVEPFGISQPAISKHLKVLERGGLIERRVVGTTRPCRLKAEALDGIDEWLAHLREALTTNYDRLDHLLAGLQAASGAGSATTRSRSRKKERLT